MMMKLKILATFTLVVNWLHLRCVKQLRHGNQFIFRSRWSIISLHLVSNQTPWSLHTQSWDHQQPPGKFPPPTNSWLTNLNDFCQQTFSVTCSLSSHKLTTNNFTLGELCKNYWPCFFILFVKLGFTKEIVISAWMGLDAPADIYSICWKPLREVLELSWEILLFTYSLNLSDFSSDKEYFLDDLFPHNV